MVITNVLESSSGRVLFFDKSTLQLYTFGTLFATSSTSIASTFSFATGMVIAQLSVNLCSVSLFPTSRTALTALSHLELSALRNVWPSSKRLV